MTDWDLVKVAAALIVAAYTIKGIDRKVWAKFHAKCVMVGVTMKVKLNALIAQDVKPRPHRKAIPSTA